MNKQMIELTEGEVIFIYDALRELSFIYDFDSLELIDECRRILSPHLDNKTGEVHE